MVARSRKARRGAALVESLITAATLTIFLMGVVYVKRLYLRTLQVDQASRASDFAYALGGCAGGDPRASLSAEAKQGVALRGPDVSAVSSGAFPASTQGSSTLEGAERSAGLGLPQAVTMEASGSASLQSSGRGTVFSATVTTHDYVVCNEVPKDGGFDGLLDEVKSFFTP
jgi:hypothetical protein